MHIFDRADIKVNDTFIKKFAERYVQQRTASVTPAKTISANFLFKNTGFDTTDLEKIITRNVIAEDKKREAGETPAVLNDIYRSDLGELLLTYYFEEKIAIPKRFKIPVKNLSVRELSHLPGRGMDAIGYRLVGQKVNLLFGEAKVSHSTDSPPSVVHHTEDSIYKTHLKHKTDLRAVLKKLSEYYKHLIPEDAAMIGFAIWAIENNKDTNYEITFGCTLVRDSTCVNAVSDYGKMKSSKTDFEPHEVHFGLLSFTEKTIAETIELFYKAVYKIAA
ncbi:MAG: hypothetical protein HY960_06305 [Ignavibacteriae bacterium]|nr:hypothetical protein [Ignavibacteriota bacterium]